MGGSSQEGKRLLSSYFPPEPVDNFQLIRFGGSRLSFGYIRTENGNIRNPCCRDADGTGAVDGMPQDGMIHRRVATARFRPDRNLRSAARCPARASRSVA